MLLGTSADEGTSGISRVCATLRGVERCDAMSEAEGEMRLPAAVLSRVGRRRIEEARTRAALIKE